MKHVKGSVPFMQMKMDYVYCPGIKAFYFRYATFGGEGMHAHRMEQVKDLTTYEQFFYRHS